MTLYYTLVFVILIVEMVLFGVLVLPLPLKWRRAMLTFVSTSKIVSRTRTFLYVAFAFVFILFLDSISLMQRVGNEYNNEASHVVRDVRTDTNLSARKFYAQRNMYLTGFTLFLSLILNRTYSLIIDILRSDERLEKQMETENKLKERVAELEEELESKKNV